MFEQLGDKLRHRLGGRGHTAHIRAFGHLVDIEHRGSANDLAAINGYFRDNQYGIPASVAGYAELKRKLYDKIVAAGKRPLILDCGANIGAASAWFRALYRGAHIVAIEPAADNFEYLVRNTIALNVERVRGGIDSVDGSAALHDAGDGPDGYRTDPNGAGEKFPMLSVDTIVWNYGADCIPFILKVDIEGYESRLFEQGTEALAAFPVIVVELHDWLLPGAGTALNLFRFHTSGAA